MSHAPSGVLAVAALTSLLGAILESTFTNSPYFPLPKPADGFASCGCYLEFLDRQTQAKAAKVIFMRILVFGNSGCGKTTLCGELARRYGVPHLDLDAIVWEPGKIAVQRPMSNILTALDEYMGAHPSWAIEGCYGELIEHASSRCTRLVFINPGRETCLRQNSHRPWEPHKYVSAEVQEAMLANLQAWISSYYERDDAWSFRAHRALFDAFDGSKRECVEPVTAALLHPWLV